MDCICRRGAGHKRILYAITTTRLYGRSGVSLNLRISALAIVGLMGVATHAAAVDYQKEFDKKVSAAQNVSVLGDDLAGDRVNLLNGTVSFNATDASVPGNNALPVALSRFYRVDFDNAGGPFGDWDLDVPFLSAVVAADIGWVVDSVHPLERCSIDGDNRSDNSGPASGAPPRVTVPEDNGFRGQTHTFYAQDYWHGYSMHLPGGEQTLLAAGATNTQRPLNGKSYHWTTNQNWWFACLAPSAAAGNGEGFEAISPDGTIYTFDQLTWRGGDAVTASDDWSEGGLPQTFHFTLGRAEARLYASQVTDRFGNWVKYNWSGPNLASITSSDGRSIILTYTNGLVSSVTDGVRAWTYSYTYSATNNLNTLTRVTQPDGSFWQYDLLAVSSLHRPDMTCSSPGGGWPAAWDCYGGGAYISNVATSAYVVHPSGARVDFAFDAHFQYSANAPLRGSYPLSLTQKTITGPGLAPATWKYGFAPSAEETRTACRSAAGCPAYVVADELDPDNGVVRRIFDRDTLQQDEFKGSASAVASSGGTPALTTSVRFGAFIDRPSPVLGGATPVFYRETDSRYVPATDAVPFVVRVGVNPLANGETFASERRLPLKTRIVTLQAATFSRNTDSFDAYAQPVQVTASSGGLAGPATGYSRSDTTVYAHDTAKWVLGQIVSVTNVGTGLVVSRTDYDSELRLPIRNFSFGVLRQTLAYRPDGTLLSVADGAGNLTSLADWNRGTPQTITFASAKTVSAVVNSIGNISSATDMQGSTSVYGYDAMGRLASIGYPTGDAVAWNPTLRSFLSVGAPEYGLPANHWKQTVGTGNSRTTTYYDGRWNAVLTITEDTGNSGTQSFIVKRFDAMGRESFSSYPVASASIGDALKGVVTEYDALGRPFRVKQDSDNNSVLTSTTDYLPGFQTRVTNPRSFKTTTSFQAFDSPTTDAPTYIVAPQGVTTSIVRDNFGKPLSVTRAGPGA